MHCARESHKKIEVQECVWVCVGVEFQNLPHFFPFQLDTTIQANLSNKFQMNVSYIGTCSHIRRCGTDAFCGSALWAMLALGTTHHRVFRRNTSTYTVHFSVYNTN